MKLLETDIAIVGGGIAGLWLFNRVKQQGFSAILLESDALGSGQTIKSQGIIHGGMKYALLGEMTESARALNNIPNIWRACLEGNGEIDLSSVSILSSAQYLWTTSILSKFAGIFASKTLKSDTKKLEKHEYPEIFRSPLFKGEVYALDEMVLDAREIVQALAEPYREYIYKMDPLHDISLDENDHIISLKTSDGITIKAQKYIFTAGSGNEQLLKKLKNSPLAMQKRPLHMVMVKHDIATPVYGHCLGLSALPRLTITTHRISYDKYIWYIGGQIAEAGVKRDRVAQIDATKKELQELFPWCDLSRAEYSSFFVDRAENKEPDGSRPAHCYFKDFGNIIVAWPTKLAFAPQLAAEILKQLNITPADCHLDDNVLLPRPNIANLPWESMF